LIHNYEVTEAAGIARLAANMLLVTSSDQKGQSASAVRRACGYVLAYAERYIVDNVIADKLSDCFEETRLAGATLDEFNRVREAIVATDVNSVLAVIVKQVCIAFSLQQLSVLISDFEFKSRQDVDRVRVEIHPAFDQAEQVAADEMALVTYKSLVALHAAVTFHLYETARPLPQMLDYSFGTPRPTLVLSHRLYDTAARADQLREENKVVHPAFAPRAGRALAF
jgi:prophage DNA circulation protein